MKANINIHRLDTAFDIDPLFHKMSKTFDEGGAKGLLLANLCVGRSGCNIVFDSTLDHEVDDSTEYPNEEEARVDGERNPKTSTASKNSKLAIDVTTLTGKLESLLLNATGNKSSIDSMPLVPQLASLRNQYAELGKDGFVEEFGSSVRITKFQT